MGHYLPPYLNKFVAALEKELVLAEKKELKAKKDYEFAVEYKNIVKAKLEEAKKNEKK